MVIEIGTYKNSASFRGWIKGDGWIVFIPFDGVPMSYLCNEDSSVIE